MPRLEISLLGRYTAQLDGVPLRAFDSDKVRALLAYLAVESSVPQRRDHLLGLLWPEQPETQARHSLNQAVYNLRNLLGDRGTGSLSGDVPVSAHKRAGAAVPFLLLEAQSIQLNPQVDVWLDVVAFKDLLLSCAHHTHARLVACPECMIYLDQAVALYRGDFLAGFSPHGCQAFDEWLLLQGENLRRQASEALQHLVDIYEWRGFLDQALKYAYRLTEINPLSEKVQRQIMRLLALNGQRAEALAHFQSWATLLRDELDTTPEDETCALYERLRTESSGMLLLTGGNLPAFLTPFVGRLAERAELCALLADPACRLITVLGPGGCGKTRLALEAATTRRYNFPHGVYWVSLSALPSPISILPALAEALGFTLWEGGDPRRQMLDYLRQQSLLLVLDSFEGVLPGAELAVEILHASPGTKILATSRSRLNVKGEQVFRLEGMRFPEADRVNDAETFSAVQLFLEGARRVRPGFRIDPEDLKDIVNICHHVAGMPLGVLLASSWVEMYTPAEIASEIERSLDFLATDWKDVPDRQLSIRATFDYSWSLLSKNEQQTLCSLSVFRGSFTRREAERVAEAAQGDLRSLVEKCLLESAYLGRFHLHDLLRKYAAEKLTANSQVEFAVKGRHAALFLSRLPDWAAAIKSASQVHALAEMDAASNELYAAWEWASLAGHLSLLAQSLEGLGLFYWLRVRLIEGERIFHETAERLDSESQNAQVLRLRGEALAWQAHFLRLLGKTEHVPDLLEQARRTLDQAAAAGEDSRMGIALISFVAGRFHSNLPNQRECFQRSISNWSELEEHWWTARALNYAALTFSRLGDVEAAQRCNAQSLEIHESIGEPGGLALSLVNLAYEQAISGYPALGERTMQRAAEYHRLAGNLTGNADALLHLGVIAGWNGRFTEARATLEQSLDLLQQVGFRYGEAICRVGLAFANLHMGEYTIAGQQIDVLLKLACEDGFWREYAAAQLVSGCLALAEGDALRALEHCERSISCYQRQQFTDELSWAEGGRALALRALNRGEQAWTSVQEALDWAVRHRSMFPVLTCLPAAALLLIDRGKVDAALEAYASTQFAPVMANSHWLEQIAGLEIEVAAAGLPAAASAAARQRGTSGDIFAAVDRLSASLRLEFPEADQARPI